MNGKDRTVTLTGLLITMVAIAGSLAFGTDLPPETVARGLDPDLYSPHSAQLEEIAEYGEENTEKSFTVEVTQRWIIAVTFTLLWADETDAGPRFTNTPDSMSLSVTPPGLPSRSAGPDTSGSLEVQVAFAGPTDLDFDEWLVSVAVGECGDQEPLVNILGLRAQPDDGNIFVVQGRVDYMARTGEPGSGDPKSGVLMPLSATGGGICMPSAAGPVLDPPSSGHPPRPGAAALTLGAQALPEALSTGGALT